MKISYITTDFDFESTKNLEPVIQEIGDEIVLQLNQWIEEKNYVSYSGNGAETYGQNPEKTINEFCQLIENLSVRSMILWKSCVKKTADIAFVSGNEPNNMAYNLPTRTISRLADLGVELTITIYPIGHI